MKPRVLLLTPFPPYPPDNGGVLRIFSMIKRLKDRCDFSLLTFVSGEGEACVQHQAALLALKTVFSEVRFVAKETTDAAGPEPAAFAPLPAFAREWYSAEFSAQLRKILSEGKIDLVHAEFLQMAAYAGELSGIPSVLTEHDASHLSLSKSYFREWSRGRGAGQRRQWILTKKFHREACRRFKRVVVLTPGDEKIIGGILKKERIRRIPTCVDLEEFSYRPIGKEARRFSMAYVGHYPHFPNEDAALWFCGKILPQIRKEIPEAALALLGSAPTPPIRELAGPGIFVSGKVPRIAPLLDQAEIFIAPIRLGYGVKGKVLEAFARGLPVVATTAVRRGIPECRAERDILVADTPRDFARQCVRLLRDAALRSRLAKNARAMVEAHYDWDDSISKLDRLYRELLGERAGRSNALRSAA